MKNDTMKIFKATILALSLGLIVYGAFYLHEQTPSPGTILLQNTLQGTDKVSFFDSRLSPYSSDEGRPALFTLHSQDAKAFAKLLNLRKV